MPAIWGLPGLDEATADRLYDQVKSQTLASPQPEPIRMTYTDEWLDAAVLAGSPIEEDPKVRGTCPLHAASLEERRAMRGAL